MTTNLDLRMRDAALALLAVLALVLWSGAAHALDVQSAKAQGLVGEQLDGYLGIPKPPGSSEVQKLVADTNLKRREHYQEIATQSGTSLENVELLAGQKLIEGAKKGEFVRVKDGSWTQK